MSQISLPERLRVQRVLEQAHRTDFTFESANLIADRLRSGLMAAASFSMEGSHETPLEREMVEQLIRRRIPADLMAKLLLDDLLEHAGADAA